MKKRILSLVLCAAMLLSMCLFLGAGVTNSLTVCDSSGEAVKRVDLPVNQKISLTAQAQSAAENDAYQWQIQAAKNVWANILGSDAQTLELSYPMVASALSEKNTVQIRCRLTSAETGEATFSDVVTVEVTAATAVDTPASADAAAAPVLRSPAKVAAAVNDAPETCTIEIKYEFENGTQAAPSWTATVAKGSDYSMTITSPTVVGYAPDQETVAIDVKGIQKDEIFHVTYKPALVDFTVKYYQQNVNDDRYSLFETKTKQGYTGKPVSTYATGTNGFDVNYDGFTRLLYDGTATIAADGSTVVELYYDRNYYLMNFNLDGGYGVEPIYARYDAPISVGNPTKPGYTFESWTPSIPATMPADNTSYTASWNRCRDTAFTVAFYYENADDNGYTFMDSKVYQGTTGDRVSGSAYKDENFSGKDTKHFTYFDGKTDKNIEIKGDGSTVVKVYFSRNVYKMSFYGITCGKKENWRHSHSKKCCKKVTESFSAKYNANIAQQYAGITKNHRWSRWDADACTALVSYMPDDFNPNALKYWQKSDGDTVYNITYAYESENGTINHDGKKFTALATSNVPMSYVGYSEDYLPAVRNGYSAYKEYSKAASPGFPENGQIYTKNVTLYYYANPYTLRFMNAETELHTANVKYNFSIKSNSSFTPDASYAPNGMVFDCWCLDSAGAQPVDWSTQKMPAGDLVLYARWKPRIHAVKTYKTENDLITGADPKQTWEVSHGTAVPENDPPVTPENGNYTFVGWFYKDDDGTEHAFDFSMPVNRDLNLYAKWSSNTLMEYTIHYKLRNGDTTIAQDTKGSALAGSTKTFEAKTGDQLNDGYRSGYFPETSSHSITMDIEGTAENGKNDFTFYYVQKDKVKYTVRYLEKGTNNVLYEEKKGETSDAVITKKFEPIPGYAPDAYQKRLVLSANEEENVLVFWYTKDTVHAPVQIIHWTQNIEGEGYTEYQSSTDLNGMIGQEYPAQKLTNLPGFKFNADKSKTSGTVAAGGLVLNLYYDRIEYPYAFQFLEQGTDTELWGPVTDYARYQAQVTETAPSIPGYTLVSAESQAINIAIENPVDKPSKNVKTFYYQEKTVDIKYVAVGSGTLDNYQEAQLKVLTGTAKGSAPTAEKGYKFVGWYTDAGCTQSVDESWVGANNKLMPQKNASGQFKAATYYAKFERDVFDLTIEKTGEKIDQHQTFVFRVQGEGVDMQVVITGTNKQVIKNLPVGNYTITEDTNWSWKYTPKSEDQFVTTSDIENGTATVTFENENKGTNWLTSLAKALNVWTKDGTTVTRDPKN